MIDFNQYSLEELSLLNKNLVEHLKVRQQRESQLDMQRFELGDRVSFTASDDQVIEGEIIRFNQKTITVCANNHHWRVSPQLLTKVIITTIAQSQSLKSSSNPIIPSRNAPCPCGSGKKSKRCCFP